ncbi:MAG: hypothetical protein JSS81_21990 [Acidobacteria bacterium]|nr:hypothetical protein [Acidobacteriota bacterium]
MSIFEDLIEELKEENLLEETVIEVRHQKARPVDPHFESVNPEKIPATPAFEAGDSQPTNGSLDNLERAGLAEGAPDEPIYEAEAIHITNEQWPAEIDAAAPAPDAAAPETETEFYGGEPKVHHEVEKPKGMVSEKEYFRKRAMDEVTGLQMVEHVLSGVEREQMKTIPKPFDDLPVKLALHDFLQDTHDTSSTEHAQAEFRLMQETENWYSALSHRDKNITVAHLRRYCETSRPALSAQALIALARFYRNSPFSESVRSKFDLVVTRLFSREIEFEKRELLLDRREMVDHLKALYSDWASIQVYSADDEDSEILISKLKFEDFIKEAEETKTFEDLINHDFFSRLRSFKESCQENYFAPIVTARAIESNIRIGNRYIDLLHKEKENSNVSVLEEKYGFLHDQAVSDATGKTLQLLELLKERSEHGRAAEIVDISVKDEEHVYRLPESKPRNKFLAVNKWLLAATVLTVLVCTSLYFWAEYEVKETTKNSPGVIKVNLENSVMQDYIQTGRIADETFFGITQANWESLNSEKKEELLQKILDIGPSKGYKRVRLINPNGKSVGFASADKVEVYHQ